MWDSPEVRDNYNTNLKQIYQNQVIPAVAIMEKQLGESVRAIKLVIPKAGNTAVVLFIPESCYTDPSNIVLDVVGGYAHTTVCHFRLEGGWMFSNHLRWLEGSEIEEMLSP